MVQKRTIIDLTKIEEKFSMLSTRDFKVWAKNTLEKELESLDIQKVTQQLIQKQTAETPAP